MNQPWIYMCSPSWTPLPPPPDPIPLGLPRAPAPALVSCIQPGLVICFTLDNIPVLMLFSQNIPPSPSPTTPLPTSILGTSCLFCVYDTVFVMFDYLFCFLDSTYSEITQYSPFPDLFYLASCPLGPSMLLQKARLCSCLWFVIRTHLLSPFTYWWALWVLLYLRYCK